MNEKPYSHEKPVFDPELFEEESARIQYGTNCTEQHADRVVYYQWLKYGYDTTVINDYLKQKAKKKNDRN